MNGAPAIHHSFEPPSSDRREALSVIRSEKPRCSVSPQYEIAVRRAQEFWSRKYGQPISEKEAKEIQENLFGFFKLLGQWRRERDGNQLGSARPNEVGSEG